MPQALEIDHEPVKAVALQIGVREAARQFGLSENTVRQWSAREKWFSTNTLVDKARSNLVARQGLEPVVTKSLSDVLSSLGSKSKLRAAKIGDSTLRAIGKKKNDALIAVAPAFKTTVDALAKVHQWDSAPTTALQVNVNLTGARYEEAKPS